MKKVFKFSLILAIPLVLLFLVGFFLFHEREYHIKTEYGDSFIICGGGFSGEYCILNEKSEIIAPIHTFNGKSDLQPICDSDLFRAYSFINEEEDIYIMKIKKYDYFFIIDKNDTTYTKHLFESNRGEIIKNEFLSDIDLMTIVLPYFNQYYHNELVDIAQTLNSENIQFLKQYGLSQEMIDDRDTLNQKKQLIISFLDTK